MAAALEYNGFVFAVTDRYKTDCRIRPIMDEARRTTIAVEYTIHVAFYLSGGTNTNMALIRGLLTAQGGELKYSDLGMGVTFHVNGASATRDAMWGPRTEEISFDPLGGDGQAAYVEWRVITVIAECPDADDFDEHLMALNYEVQYTLDRGGYTTMTTTGYMEIAMTYDENGSTTPPDSVDNYRERLRNREPPLGFRREEQRYTVSKDRRRLDFAIVDKQLPRELPDDMVDVQFRVNLQTSGPVVAIIDAAGGGGGGGDGGVGGVIAKVGGGALAGAGIGSFAGSFAGPGGAAVGALIGGGIGAVAGGVAASGGNTKLSIGASAAAAIGAAAPQRVAAFWEVRYSASIEAARRVSGRAALDVFLRLVGERYPERGGKAGLTLWKQISVEEEMFGRIHRFTLTARCCTQLSLPEVVASFKLWTPATRDSFERWRATMKRDEVSTVRGHAGLYFGPNDDVIIDICSDEAAEAVPPAGETPRLLKTQPAPLDPGRRVGPRPRPQDTWIDWHCWFRWMERSNSVPHKPLPPDRPGSNTSIFGQPDGSSTGGGLFQGDRTQQVSGTLYAGPPAPPPITLYAGPGTGVREVKGSGEGSPDIIQKACSATRYCQLWGHAMRAGSPIPIPALVAAGGARAVEVDRDVQQGVSGAVGGMPLYWAAWIITYAVPEPPTGPLPIPPNVLVR